MSSVLIFLEGSQGKLKKSSLELISAGKGSGRECFGVALGTSAQLLAEEAAQYGLNRVFISTDSSLDRYNPEVFVPLVEEALKTSGAKLVLASSSSLGRDLFPRLAARVNGGLASDCTELELTKDNLRVRKPLFAGKCSAQVDFADGVIPFVLVRANQLPVSVPAGQGPSETLTLNSPIKAERTQVVDVVQGQSGAVDLTEANIIVSGGRGLQNAENFKLLENLASVVGGSVGASRAVADAGWVPHSMQVGQTGKTVAPTLYIACGISGAIQHLAGMSGSKVIVAINKDPDAPIFQKSTYGVVGDLFEVVPKLTDELGQLLK